MKYTALTLPMLSANDDEVKVAAWHCTEGSLVNKGQLFCELETTKSVHEQFAQREGYIYFVMKEGESNAVGAPFAFLLESKNDDVKDDIIKDICTPKVSGNGRSWTKKAELLARKHGLDVKQLEKQHEVAITEKIVTDWIAQTLSAQHKVPQSTLQPEVHRGLKKRVVVIGAGVGAVQIVDILHRSTDQEVVALLDDNTALHGKTIFDYPIVGALSAVSKIAKEFPFDGVVISMSQDLSLRASLFEKFKKEGIPFTNVIDSSVQINTNAELGTGNVILANCTIAACASVGDNNFISAYTNIEHHNVLGSHCSFGPGVMTSGEVIIKDQVKFGTGIFIEPKVTIGSKCRIASGSILTADVKEQTIVKRMSPRTSSATS